jgi:hypothetical protein
MGTPTERVDGPWYHRARRLTQVKLARAVERRLERLLDGMAGKVFHGRVHPTEIAQRLVREADLESTDHPTGTMVHNAMTVYLHPEDLDLPPASLSRVLAEAFEAHAAEEGWRLPGPTYVNVRLDPSLSPGSIVTKAETRRGYRRPWGRLSGPSSHDLTNNRMWLGRAGDNDVVLPYEEVSRAHAAMVRRHGSVWVTELGSANGTAVDGERVGDDPVEFRPGSVITFANHTFRLEIA